MAQVKDFKPAARNANAHTARGLGTIDKSMRTDGYGDPMLAAADGEMISGSARLETVANVFGVEIEPIIVHSDGTRPVIHVRDDIPNAQDKRAVRLALAANRSAELDLSWDVEVLAGLDADVLEGLWTADELSDLGQQWADEQGKGTDDQYSRKIESPVYEPKNPKPAATELFDDAKTKTLLVAIEEADWLTEDERVFLTIAARRHTVIHYNKVADFYAHSPKTTQALMEDSALVIIDFNRAIELGYVKLAEEIAKQYGVDYGAA